MTVGCPPRRRRRALRCAARNGRRGTGRGGPIPGPPGGDAAGSPTRTAWPGPARAHFPSLDPLPLCSESSGSGCVPHRPKNRMRMFNFRSVAKPTPCPPAGAAQPVTALADSELTSLCRALPARGQYGGPPRGAAFQPLARGLLDS